jgi:elongation factor P
MAGTSDIKRGMCFRKNSDIFVIVEFQHVKPGKGAAFVRTKYKSLTTGRVLEENIPAGHKIDDVRVERRKFQYLYNDDSGYHFMNQETFDQTFLAGTMIDNTALLKEGTEVDILFDAQEEIALTLDMPQYITLKVTYTEPGVKGDTATNTLKPATVETGAEVRVPLFINEGDLIKLDTQTSAYVERVKK